MNNVSTSPVINIRNGSAETIPAFGIVKLSTLFGTTPDGQPILNVIKPDGDVNGKYAVVLGVALEDGAEGTAVRLLDARCVAIDDDTIASMDEIGPAADTFFAQQNGSGLLVCAEPDDTTGTVPVFGLAAGTGGTTAVSEQCPCSCLEYGDESRYSVAVPSRQVVTFAKDELFKQTNGTITFPATVVTCVLQSGTPCVWLADIGDLLTSKYTDGSDATGDTTMDGEVKVEWSGPGTVATVKLCVTGTVPAP